jgi:Ser/Thr protein kinase RdoA (MazF antagonist)
VEDKIRKRYHTEILEEVRGRFDIDPKDINLLDGFESYIYEFSQNGKQYILRIGHTLRRSIEHIEGEIDWINFLSAGGAHVSKAVYSAQDNLVESVPDRCGGFFLATAFEKAPGAPPGKDDLTSVFFHRYGQLLGRIHSLSKQYKPSNESWRRPDWNDREMLNVEEWLDGADQVALYKYNQLTSYIDRLPKSNSDFGLIHQDAHYGNMFLDEKGQLTLFDFDDCCYSWYVNDVAIVLFYAALFRENPASFTDRFLKDFLSGYSQETDLDSAWIKEIPYFLKLREIDLYAVIHRSFDVENIDNAWVAGYMRNRKERIHNEVPFIDYDFNGLSVI